MNVWKKITNILCDVHILLGTLLITSLHRYHRHLLDAHEVIVEDLRSPRAKQFISTPLIANRSRLWVHGSFNLAWYFLIFDTVLSLPSPPDKGNWPSSSPTSNRPPFECVETASSPSRLGPALRALPPLSPSTPRRYRWSNLHRASSAQWPWSARRPILATRTPSSSGSRRPVSSWPCRKWSRSRWSRPSSTTPRTVRNRTLRSWQQWCPQAPCSLWCSLDKWVLVRSRYKKCCWRLDVVFIGLIAWLFFAARDHRQIWAWDSMFPNWITQNKRLLSKISNVSIFESSSQGKYCDRELLNPVSLNISEHCVKMWV